jgi:5-methylcytosine-specific restriction protein A
MRVCSQPGCPAIHDGTDSRCDQHRKVANQQHWAQTRAYNTKGHRIRFRPGVLAKDPICVLCHVAQATDADHYPLSRQDLLEQGLDADDPQYGRGLCSTCHKQQTSQHQPGGWNNRNP